MCYIRKYICKAFLYVIIPIFALGILNSLDSLALNYRISQQEIREQNLLLPGFKNKV